MLLTETFPTGPLGCNTTLVADPASREAIVVDPGGDEDKISERLKFHDLTVKAIIHTHAHIDHIGATRPVKERHGGAIGLHRGDLFLYDGWSMQAAFLGLHMRPVLPVDRFLGDGDVVGFGRRLVRVIHTPGHTPGSLCFSIEAGDGDGKSLLLSGDTLFRRGIGRTDLWGGDSGLIVRSIRERLYALDPETLVIPGHGPTTTVHEEAAKNPFVRAS